MKYLFRVRQSKDKKFVRITGAEKAPDYAEYKRSTYGGWVVETYVLPTLKDANRARDELIRLYSRELKAADTSREELRKLLIKGPFKLRCCAEMLGCHYTTLQRVLSGENWIDPRRLVNIMMLKKDLDALLNKYRHLQPLHRRRPKRVKDKEEI